MNWRVINSGCLLLLAGLTWVGLWYFQGWAAEDYSSITDVPGVQVGHVTLLQDAPHRIRTGVTAIVPNMSALTAGQGNMATHALPAAVAVHGGNGVLTGASFIQDFGMLSGPIILTNTEAVGTAYTAVRQYMRQTFTEPWQAGIPVVGECWDGVFNDLEHTPITQAHVVQAIQSANTGPITQGSVGAGTGMRSFGLHAGIGSSSQLVSIGQREYVLGALVNMNHSRFDQLSDEFRKTLAADIGDLDVHYQHDEGDRFSSPDSADILSGDAFRKGSIVIVVATDAPLLPHQLELLAKRAWLGVGKTGSTGATHSGDFTIAFSTYHAVTLSDPIAHPWMALATSQINPLLEAVVEQVYQAQRNAIVASHRPAQSVP